MSERDIARVARILKAAEGGDLSDITVYAILAAVRAEAVMEERAREAKRIQAAGLKHLVRGERDTALAFEELAEGLELPAPPERLHA